MADPAAPMTDERLARETRRTAVLRVACPACHEAKGAPCSTCDGSGMVTATIRYVTGPIPTPDQEPRR